MVRPLIFGLLLVGCTESTVQHHPKPKPDDYDYSGYDESSVKPPVLGDNVAPSAGEPLPRQEKPVDEKKCEELREKARDVGHRLIEAREKREQWAKDHCTGTLKYETRVTPTWRASAGPTAVWVCDGKIVDAPYSVSEARLSTARSLYVNDMKEAGCFRGP